MPDGVKQASWQFDTKPWGSNEGFPSIEIYPGKHVCVMTGAHVPGTPTEVREWNDEVATRQRTDVDDRDDVSTDRADYDLGVVHIAGRT